MTTPKILTDAELAEIRAQVSGRDPRFGGGYTWTTIEQLLDTVDALRTRRPHSSEELVRTVRTPALCDDVIFTDANGRRHAAKITVDPEPGLMAVDLSVFRYAGEPCFPISAVPFSAEGAGDSWTWPAHLVTAETGGK